VIRVIPILLAAALPVIPMAPAFADDSAPAFPAESGMDRASICYNYGCNAQAEVEFTPSQLAALDRLFAAVHNAAEERQVLARAIGRLYFFAGASTPIWHDHGMNYRDNGVDGMMDCIDHSRNTSEFLLLLQRRGLLRYHEVHTRLRRTSYLIAYHWTARVAEVATGAEYAVDSWYFEPGEPAAVMPIADWLKRRDPRG
jgi:hypothetical protein